MSPEDRPLGVKRLDLPSFQSEQGVLIVGEAPQDLGFRVTRAFLVCDAPQGAMRGGHAHRVCTQLLICVSGEVEVSVDDGQRSSNYLLDDPRTGLLIGPLLWSQQIYLHAESTLLVLADEPYDEREYIRSRDDFERLVQPNRESKESFDP